MVYHFTQLFHLGAGGTWPGEIVFKLNPNILSSFLKSFDKGIIIVAGTNGKTTTSLMIKQILEKNNESVVHNETGANLINGIISSLIIKADWNGKIKADWGVFEVDENVLPILINQIKQNVIARNEETKQSSLIHQKDRHVKSDLVRDDKGGKKLIIVLLNLFRDQLDRYGEVDVIVEKWQKALQQIKFNTSLILNSDDPAVAYLGKNIKVPIKYFGIDDPQEFLPDQEHATDSGFCLNCGSRLTYEGIYFSHLGIWKCEKCGNIRPIPDLSIWDEVMPGLYNKYNTLAAVSVGKEIGIKDEIIKKGLQNFHPAFGRQEEFKIKDKKIKIFLSKNPAGFNASLRTVIELNPKTIMLALNDRVPDGKDISWIWDVDFEMIFDEREIKTHDERRIIVSGDRTYDMGLRMKYSSNFQFPISNFQSNSEIKNTNVLNDIRIEQNLKQAINLGLDKIDNGETLYILATYSAMLEVRKILTGKKIL